MEGTLRTIIRQEKLSVFNNKKNQICCSTLRFYSKHSDSACPQTSVRKAAFEPGTTASEVWSIVNECPHLHFFQESNLLNALYED